MFRKGGLSAGAVAGLMKNVLEVLEQLLPIGADGAGEEFGSTLADGDMGMGEEPLPPRGVDLAGRDLVGLDRGQELFLPVVSRQEDVEDLNANGRRVARPSCD